MIDEIEWPRLARYLAGESTPVEAAEVRAWLEDEPTRAAEAAALREVWETTGQWARGVAEREAFDAVPAWRSVVARKRERDLERERPRARFLGFANRSGPLRTLWRVAAAVGLIGGGTLLWQVARERVAETPVAMQELVTPRGRRAEVRLGDGTRIVLGVASKLRFAPAFTGRRRDVFLEYGEAYFEVTHDADRPFLVHAPGAIAEDLGTAFSVRAYADDPHVEVVVAEGEVGLGRPRVAPGVSVTSLTPGQLGRLDRVTGRIDVRHVEPARELAWVRGALVFDNVPLAHVVAELERWYDVEFRIADSAIVTRPLTASFEHESITQVLDVIAPSLDIRVSRDADTIVLESRP